MKSSFILDSNKKQKSLFKKKFKIINLHKKPEEKLYFSQSLYLSNFLYNTKFKKTPKTSKYSSQNSLLISKYKIIDDKNKTINNQKKSIKLNMSKINTNNSFISIRSKIPNSFHNNTNISFSIKDENPDKSFLYEENIKLKAKINKLRFDLFLNKRLNEKKDEEIKEMNKNLEEAKILFEKKKEKIYYINKINYEKKIIRLKNYYENVKFQLREAKEENNILMSKIKAINNEELMHNNEEEIKKLKKKRDELNFKDIKNIMASKKLKNFNSNKQKYIENYEYLNNLKTKINKQSLKVGKLNQKAYILKDKYYDIKSQKGKLLRYNKNIKIRNKELVIDIKNKENLLLKKIQIEKKINSFSTKTRDLKDKIGQSEISINHYINEQKNIIESKNKSFEDINKLNKLKINARLEENKIKQIVICESLINESKERQKNFVKLLYDLLESISNISLEKEKSDVSEDKMHLMDNGNIEYKNMNNINNININNMNNIKEEKVEYELEKYGDIGEFQFLLNVMFYIKDIKKERIQNILLCYKTENYYLGNENNDFVPELCKDILLVINNKKDENKLKEILVDLFENKYEKNKIEFLNKILDDIYILDNDKKILFNKEDENVLFHKLLNKIKNKINYMIKKINDFQGKIILFEDLKSFFTEEYLYDKENKEKMQLFQFFIYILKKKENSWKNISLTEFNRKDAFDVLSNLEVESIIIENFIKALKNILEEKKMDLDSFIGYKKNLDIEEFINILNENKFDFNGQNIDFNDVLKNYKIDENSDNIDIDLLKLDLKNFCSF